MNKLELQQALLKPLPGESSRLKLTHSSRFNYSHETPPRQNAVAIIIYNKNNELHCLYTKRQNNKRDKHSGQISFPGGGFEKQDANLLETAIRECKEEIGLLIHEHEIIGTLTDLYIPVSNNNVKPFVAFLDDAPKSFQLQNSEIAKIIEVPVLHMLKAESIKEKTIEHRGKTITVPYYEYGEHHIWGATGMMTAELLEVFKICKINKITD